MDWAQMLERMYLRWADSQGFKSAIVDRLEGLHVIYKSLAPYLP